MTAPNQDVQKILDEAYYSLASFGQETWTVEAMAKIRRTMEDVVSMDSEDKMVEALILIMKRVLEDGGIKFVASARVLCAAIARERGH